MQLNKLLNKKLSIRYTFLLFFFMLVLMLVWGNVVRNLYAFGYKKYFNNQTVKAIASSYTIAKSSVQQIFLPSQQIIPNRFQQTNQFAFYSKQQDSGYLLNSFFDASKGYNIIQLISIKDNQIIHQWNPPLDVIRSKTSNINKYFTSGNLSNKVARAVNPFLLKDGSIIFSSPGGPLVKLDSNSHLIWMVNNYFHHSTEIDAEGNIWAPSDMDTATINEEKFGPLLDDAITKISPQGAILYKKSVTQLLIENGYTAIALGFIGNTEDIVHLNEIRPALYSSKYWQKDDLLISMRHKSTIFLYRPSTNKIIWLQTGPWLNQHCPDFLDSTHISVFGNDVVRTYSGDSLFRGYNNLYIYDFTNNKVDTPYSSIMRKNEIRTITEGRLKVFNNGDFFVEESNYGRIIKGNKQGLQWQYINKIDKNHLSIANWSRYLLKNGNCKFCFTENKYF